MTTRITLTLEGPEDPRALADALPDLLAEVIADLRATGVAVPQDRGRLRGTDRANPRAHWLLLTEVHAPRTVTDWHPAPKGTDA